MIAISEHARLTLAIDSLQRQHALYALIEQSPESVASTLIETLAKVDRALEYAADEEED